MSSRDSVVPIFKQFRNKNFVPITDKRMTRFNITLHDAIKFVLNSLHIMQGGEVFVPKIPSFRILDLAKAMYPQKKIKIIGLRPGEKIHEEMISTGDSLNTIKFKNSYIICPQTEFFKWDKKCHLKSKIGAKKFPEDTSYNSGSNSDFLSVLEIKKLLKINKFI